MIDIVTRNKIASIRSSNLTIYDPIQVGDDLYWLTAREIEFILTENLTGLNLDGLPLRTRSKVVKTAVCEAMGYDPPKSFKKTRPRFLGQDFDIYTQKSNNLQIWNEDIGPTRRYVLVIVGEDNIVNRVRVVSGDTLAKLDTTGTLTQKYQATFHRGTLRSELVSTDTTRLIGLVATRNFGQISKQTPTSEPTADSLVPIEDLHETLTTLIGNRIPLIGADQERNRGAALHALACHVLGYQGYADNGDFPDIRNQLLEIKLQTSPTIDLGLVSPDSPTHLDINQINGLQIQHCDVRYAVFYGEVAGDYIVLTDLVVTTGESFYTRFQGFGGNVTNKKIQIHLPNYLFDA